jgi:hypothetical protein
VSQTSRAPPISHSAYADRRDADALAEELYRYFAGRRVRGSRYRLTAADVRERLGRRASLEARARARAAAEGRKRTPPPTGANPKTEAGGEAAPRE